MAAVTNSRVREQGTVVLRAMIGSQNPSTVSTVSVSGVTSTSTGGTSAATSGGGGEVASFCVVIPTAGIGSVVMPIGAVRSSGGAGGANGRLRSSAPKPRLCALV
jgi:hypothetical protein